MFFVNSLFSPSSGLVFLIRNNVYLHPDETDETKPDPHLPPTLSVESLSENGIQNPNMKFTYQVSVMGILFNSLVTNSGHAKTICMFFVVLSWA
jgi:hypothetical protein